jgi:hypothetical protein
MSDDPVLAALARLEAGQGELSTRLAQVEAGQSAMRTEMATFRSGVMDELGKTRGVIMEKIEGVQADIGRIRDDIAVNFGAVDAVKRANDNTREELRSVGDLVTAMVRKVRTLEDRVRALEGGA